MVAGAADYGGGGGMAPLVGGAAPTNYGASGAPKRRGEAPMVDIAAVISDEALQRIADRAEGYRAERREKQGKDDEPKEWVGGANPNKAQNDWYCAHCGNQNYAFRDYCNGKWCQRPREECELTEEGVAKSALRGYL